MIYKVGDLVKSKKSPHASPYGIMVGIIARDECLILISWFHTGKVASYGSWEIEQYTTNLSRSE